MTASAKARHFAGFDGRYERAGKETDANSRTHGFTPSSEITRGASVRDCGPGPAKAARGADNQSKKHPVNAPASAPPSQRRFHSQKVPGTPTDCILATGVVDE